MKYLPTSQKVEKWEIKQRRIRGFVKKKVLQEHLIWRHIGQYQRMQ